MEPVIPLEMDPKLQKYEDSGWQLKGLEHIPYLKEVQVPSLIPQEWFPENCDPPTPKENYMFSGVGRKRGFPLVCESPQSPAQAHAKQLQLWKASGQEKRPKGENRWGSAEHPSGAAWGNEKVVSKANMTRCDKTFLLCDTTKCWNPKQILKSPLSFTNAPHIGCSTSHWKERDLELSANSDSLRWEKCLVSEVRNSYLEKLI